MSDTGRWSDLAARMISGAVMVAVGLGAVALGGDVFHVFVALVCGAMIWELGRMLAPETPGFAIQQGLLSGVVVLAAIYLPGMFVMPLILGAAIAGAGRLKQYRVVFALFSVLVLLAGYEMMAVRDNFGFVWMLWLVLVVVASDVAGYFAGKVLGGPKFWPRISPKKTWSGTVAGWLGAGLVAVFFVGYQGTGILLVPFSMLVAFAAQMGDVSESAIKRMVGVKDSSGLIPGHGGVLDRFDGMLGGSVFVLLVGGFFNLPTGVG
ncbi:MAG: phosphatidate cytidylyltransferase [Arenibacterium sp.]